MTSEPVVASIDEPIRDVARHMLDYAVHRVIVVDEHGRPAGVVSSTDLFGRRHGEGRRTTACRQLTRMASPERAGSVKRGVLNTCHVVSRQPS